MCQWARKYIGIPFLESGRTIEGCDCYGLLWIVLREEFGIEIPSFCERKAPKIDLQEWLPVVGPPKTGDALVFCGRGHAPQHVGIALDDQRMLHVEEGGASCVERFNSPAWFGRRWGHFRHARMGITA